MGAAPVSGSCSGAYRRAILRVTTSLTMVSRTSRKGLRRSDRELQFQGQTDAIQYFVGRALEVLAEAVEDSQSIGLVFPTSCESQVIAARKGAGERKHGTSRPGFEPHQRQGVAVAKSDRRLSRAGSGSHVDEVYGPIAFITPAQDNLMTPGACTPKLVMSRDSVRIVTVQPPHFIAPVSSTCWRTPVSKASKLVVY